MKGHFVFNLGISWRGIYRNLLEWIPRAYIVISPSPSITIYWLGFKLYLRCGIMKILGKVVYITPGLELKLLDSRFKERLDFQFSWLGYNYRKFFGSRGKYEISIEENLSK